MHGAESEHNWGEWQHLTTSHSRGCDNPGCGMTQSENCSGGTATCTEQATCEVCHEKYGNKDPDNHTDITEWIQTETKHTQKYKCCGAVAVAEEDHEWENGVCTECHYACAHSGGTATCKDKAKCETCGESYGELNANNHADLKHTATKAATKTSEGNIEYWYCSGCGKYYKDATATQEITKAQTVTAKLPDDTKSPQTGDTSNLILWITLLFVSGGAVAATIIYGRKKKRGVK